MQDHTDSRAPTLTGSEMTVSAASSAKDETAATGDPPPPKSAQLSSQFNLKTLYLSSCMLLLSH